MAKDASDITLLDDSFASIATAVMWGRSLYRNIQRFVLFQLTINFAAITICFKALAEAGDEFIVFAPFFPEYRCFVESTGASLKVVPARTEDFQIDFAAFEKLLTSHTKGVIVNSPNNPSGVVYSEETIRNLTALLAK